MAWRIDCTNESCGCESWSSDIVDLIHNHRNQEGWFLARCGKPGYIEKSFRLQEAGKYWEPYLRGIIPLGTEADTYQPFVFLVSYGPSEVVTDVWFSYYKDLRDTGGKLKLGYGPGGPPVLNKPKLLHLLRNLVTANYLTTSDIMMITRD